MDSDRIARIRADLDEVVSRGGWYVTNARNDIPWLLSQLESLTARAVRAEQLLTELQQATCRALYRVNERLDQYVMDEAFGWTNGRYGTDCGEALDALRKAAGVTVRKDANGFLEFVKDG